MYILEYNIINPKENKFSQESCLSNLDEMKDCRQGFYDQNKHLTVDGKLHQTRSKFQRDDSKWQFVLHQKYFASIINAYEYFENFVNYDHPYRKLETKFNIENDIFVEANILDVNGNLIRKTHSCTNKKCVRFGVCRSSDLGGCYSNPDILTLHDKLYSIPMNEIKLSRPIKTILIQK